MHIDGFSFGRIMVDGTAYHTDIKIVGGRLVPDWRRRSGHRVTVEDVRDILALEPEAVVIGGGSFGLMKTARELRSLLRDRGILLREAGSAKAVGIYNELSAGGKRVGAGFHVGC